MEVQIPRQVRKLRSAASKHAPPDMSPPNSDNQSESDGDNDNEESPPPEHTRPEIVLKPLDSVPLPPHLRPLPELKLKASSSSTEAHTASQSSLSSPVAHTSFVTVKQEPESEDTARPAPSDAVQHAATSAEPGATAPRTDPDTPAELPSQTAVPPMIAAAPAPRFQWNEGNQPHEPGKTRPNHACFVSVPPREQYALRYGTLRTSLRHPSSPAEQTCCHARPTR